MKIKKKITLNSILVCGRCNIEPIFHEVIERQMKDEKGKMLTRTTTTGKHCPNCFASSNFKYVLPDQVRVFKKKNADTHSS